MGGILSTCLFGLVLVKLEEMPREKGKPLVPPAEIRLVSTVIDDLVGELSRARKRKGWSQQKLAEEVNLSLEAVKTIEQGRRVPSLQTLIRVSRILGLRIILRSR